MSARQILNEGLIIGMERLGVLFKNNEVFIPEVLVAARAMNAGLTKLEPQLIKEKVEPKGLVLIGTVKGDLHDIGKNLVSMMLKGAGYKIVDLGSDVPSERFAAAAKEHRVQIVALSALLTTTMVQMKGVIQTLQAAGVTAPVIVGGAPLTQDYADQIGAQGYASDAASAVDVVNKLLA
jgi:5-methyltetrahydrofolate--homocysteine methyltransferase